MRRSRTLTREHIFEGRGPPRTNIARTLIDLSEELDEQSLDLAFFSALRRVRVLRPWLTTMLANISRKGHRNIGRLRALIASNDAALDSAFEVLLRRLFRRSQLPEPICQHPVYEGRRLIARLDFAWPDHPRPVAVLAHGLRWHGNTARWKYDLWQVSALSRLGWHVEQCVFDVLEQPDELIANLRSVLTRIL